MAIGNIDAFDQLETLENVIINDPHNGVKVTAIDVIAHWHVQNVASILIPIATDRSFALQVREAAIEGLGISDSIEASHTLTGLLNDPNTEIRYTTLAAIGNTQLPDVISKLKH